MDQIATLLPLVIIGGLFWFLIIRPQRARQAEASSTRAALAPGRRVMTTAGLFGTVVSVSDDEVELEIAPGVVVRYVTAAIARVLDDPAPAGPAAPGAGIDSRPDPAEEGDGAGA